MDTNLRIKRNLLNSIKDYSMPDFPDLKIFSKTFFKDIFMNSYQYDNIYTLLYGDIDGLRNLNKSIGFENANKAIEELLKTILYHLPDDSISSRVGGDEFCFVIPNLSASETRKLTKQIHDSLSNKKSVQGLDITFGAFDSLQFKTIQEMYKAAENKVEQKKHSHSELDKPAISIEDYNQKLNLFIDNTIKSYLNNFRFSSDRRFSREDIKILSHPVLETVSTLLSEGKNQFSKNEIISEKKSDLTCSKETSSKLCSLILKNSVDYDILDSMSTKDLNSIRNFLSTDSAIGIYNNSFKNNYLLPLLDEKNIPFQLMLFESLGIKISNSILSHSQTDIKIKNTFDSLYNELLNVIPKNSDIKILPIHSGGGTFEIFVIDNDNSSSSITNDEIQKVLRNVNSNLENFQLFGSIKKCPNISEYNEVHEELYNICEKGKNEIKNIADYFIDTNSLKLLEVSLVSAVKFFKTQSASLGIYNENQKIYFTKKIIDSLINNYYELNISNKQLYNKKDWPELSI